MTQNRRAKRAIRAQMAQTGEKYTEARRALLGAGGDDGRETPPGVGVNRPDDPLAWFTDQAYNVILLAEDEARMLGCATVEPEHLLLALARSGNAQRLLLGCRIDARAIHDAVVGMSGFGDELVRGPLPRSSASQAALRGALTEAAARGTLGPSSEHLLLALAEHASVSRVLAELGVADVRAVVDATYPVTRPPVDAAAIELRTRRRGGRVRTPPSPGPVPPLFERFTVEAHEAVGAGVKRARGSSSRRRQPVWSASAARRGSSPPPHGASSPRTCSRSPPASATASSAPGTSCLRSSSIRTRARRSSSSRSPTCGAWRPR
jgi:hypothetical protein